MFTRRIVTLFLFVSMIVSRLSAMEIGHPSPVSIAEWLDSGIGDAIESNNLQSGSGSRIPARVSFPAKSLDPAAFNRVSGMNIAMLTPSTPAWDIPVGIEELAASLNHDPDAIRLWVFLNIDYVPYFGLMKGGERTLLDRAGNDADQAALLIALMRASGRTAYYQTGALELSYDVAAQWLGVPGKTEVVNAFLNGGYANGYTFIDLGTSCLFYHIFSVVEQVPGSDEWYYLIPSLKNYVHAEGTDLQPLCGYDRANLLTAAGGASDANSVSGMDFNSLSSYLSGLACNLVSALDLDYPNGSIEELTGSRRIDQEDLMMNFNYEPHDTYYELPDAFRHKIKILAGGLEFPYDLPSIGYKKIYFTYNNGFFGRHQDGGSIQIGISGLQGIKIINDPPYPANAGTYANNTNFYPIANGGIYVLAQGYDGAENGKATEYRRKRFFAMMEDDNVSSEELFTESLALAGDTFMQETALAHSLISSACNVRRTTHSQMGLVGQDGGYYIDVKNQLFSYRPTTTGAGGDAINPYMMIFSGLEHAVLEQTQSPYKQAVSTVRILRLANAATNPVFRADNSNYSTVRPLLLQGGYDATLLDHFADTVADGGMVVLPKYSDVVLNDWTGEGYIESYANGSGGSSLFMAIAGDYNGGYGSYEGWFDEFLFCQQSQSYQYDKIWINNPTAADPVDMATGSYLFDHVDLTMAGPLSLSFSRHYSSSSSLHDGPMGHGWTHNYNIRAQEHSGYEAGLGMRSPKDAASMLVATTAVKDLLANEDSAKGWLAASLAVNWVMEQLAGNAVTIYVGQKVMTFIEQPDGSYTPPPGMTATLIKENGLYVMKERHGSTYTFDGNLKLAQIADPHGNTLTLGYNAQTNLQSIASSFGPSLAFGYTGNLLTSVADNSTPPRTVHYQYDANNNLTNCVDVAGYNWGVGYDSQHRVKWMKDPEQNTTIQNFYNSIGQVTNQISSSGHPWDFRFTGTRNVSEDPLGNQTAYYLDAKARTWSIEQPNGARSYVTFDGQNHVVQSVAPNGVTNTYAYDLEHNLLAQANAVGLPEQVVSTYGYDAGNHLRFATNALGSAEQTISEYTYTAEHVVDTVTLAKGTPDQVTTDMDYYSNGLPQLVSEGNGLRVTAYTYDSHGNPDTVASTDAGTVDYQYDIQGNLKLMTVHGKTTEFFYDDRRLPTGTIYAKGTADEVSTYRTYWKNGMLKTSTDARGKTSTTYWNSAYKQAGTVFPNTGSTTNLYDEADRLVAFRDADGNWTTTLLDCVGNPVFVSTATSAVTNEFDIVGNLKLSTVDPSGLGLWTMSDYDSLNRLKKTQSMIGSRWFQYDALGQATNRIDAANKAWATEFDALGRIRKTFRPSGNYEEYGYDENGNRTHFWNAEAKPMTFGFDAQGHVTSITNAINKITNFGYDDAGNLAWRVMPNQDVTSYGYDGMNRLVAVTNQGSVVSSMRYDRNGNTVAHASPLASGSFGYDAMNHLIASTQTVNSATAIVRYGYDLNGNRTGIVYPGGLTVGYVYGANDRIEHVTTAYGGNTKTFSFSYDSANRLDGISYPNGVNSTFGYDAESRVTSIVHGSFINRAIQRNALGFKETELIDAGLKPTTPATERSIKTHNDADQLISEQIQSGGGWTDAAYGYNANGCLTSSVSSASSVVYQYDYDNRLVTVDDGSLPSGQNGQGASFVSYLYDATGVRIGRIVEATPSSLSTNYFVVDYADGLKRPLAETDAAGNIIRCYVWSGARLLCHVEANGTVRYYHADELGSTLALTDASGNVTDQFAYIPYGYATHTGSTQTPFQWLGGYGVYYDSATDLHLTLHRAYSRTMKRFIHPDPLGIDGGANVYVYANQNPLYFVDPYGLCAEQGYLSKSWEQLWKGNYSDNVTLLGTAGQIGTGLLGVDLPGDIRDIVYDFQNWEWSLGHAGQTALDAVAFLPVVGIFKYGDEAGTLLKQSDNIKVIGRLEDTSVAKSWAGHDVLDIPDWTLQKNMDWVDDGIKNNQPFYTASPTAGNLIQSSGPYKGTPTVYSMELQRLLDANYRQVGDYYLPPTN